MQKFPTIQYYIVFFECHWSSIVFGIHCLHLRAFVQSTGEPPLETVSSQDSMFISLANNSERWFVDGRSHRQWLTDLVSMLMSSGAVKNEVMILLRPICELKVSAVDPQTPSDKFKPSTFAGFLQVEMCEEVFPMLVHSLLASGSEEHRHVLSRQMRCFFSLATSSTATSVPLASIKTMLQMILHLRTTDRCRKGCV